MTSRHQVALDRVGDNLLGVMGETLRGLMAEPNVTDIILNPPLPGELHGRPRDPAAVELSRPAVRRPPDRGQDGDGNVGGARVFMRRCRRQ